MKAFIRYMVKRLAYMLLTLFIIVTVTFFLMKLLPGTPFSNEDQLTAAQIQTLNAKYGLDQPIWVQYGRNLLNILKGDLGVSFQFNNTPVSQLIIDRAGPSMQLGLQAMLLGTVLGTFLGVISAVY